MSDLDGDGLAQVVRGCLADDMRSDGRGIF